jgi:hypothetical protein
MIALGHDALTIIKLVNQIRSYRLITGKEHPHHDELSEEIAALLDNLTEDERQYIDEYFD